MIYVGEVNTIEKEIAQVAKDTLAIYFVDRFLGDVVMMQGDSMPLRNLKRGFLWELGANLEDEVLTQNSRLRQMDYLKVLDHTVYNGLVSAGVEATNLNGAVDNLIGNVVPASEWKDSIVTALILSLSRKVGSQLENTVVKNISSLFGK